MESGKIILVVSAGGMFDLDLVFIAEQPTVLHLDDSARELSCVFMVVDAFNAFLE